MAKEIIIPGIPKVIDRLRQQGNRDERGGMLIPEIRLDGSRQEFDTAYAALLQTYGRRLKTERYQQLMPDIGRRIAKIIRLTAQLQRKTIDLSDNAQLLDFYKQPLVVDLENQEEINELVYPKVVVFDESDLTWAVKNRVILDTQIYREYTKPVCDELLKRNKVFVLRSTVFFDSGPLNRRFGL